MMFLLAGVGFSLSIEGGDDDSSTSGDATAGQTSSSGRSEVLLLS